MKLIMCNQNDDVFVYVRLSCCIHVLSESQANRGRWNNDDLNLGHRLRRWPNMKLTLFQRLDLAGSLEAAKNQQTQNICVTFVQGSPNVFDVGPTLY